MSLTKIMVNMTRPRRASIDVMRGGRGNPGAGGPAESGAVADVGVAVIATLMMIDGALGGNLL
jgi:hypothetical protein